MGKEYCSCCGPERQSPLVQWFYKDQEEDPNVYNNEIDLSGLKYKVDYEITEYP